MDNKTHKVIKRRTLNGKRIPCYRPNLRSLTNKSCGYCILLSCLKQVLQTSKTQEAMGFSSDLREREATLFFCSCFASSKGQFSGEQRQCTCHAIGFLSVTAIVHHQNVQTEMTGGDWRQRHLDLPNSGVRREKWSSTKTIKPINE